MHIPGSGSMLTTIWLGPADQWLGRKANPGTWHRKKPHFGDLLQQGLSRAQKDQHSDPPPGVDLSQQCDVSHLGLRIFLHPSEVGIVTVLTTYATLRAQYRHRSKHLDLLVVQVIGIRPHRRLPHDQRQHMQRCFVGHHAKVPTAS